MESMLSVAYFDLWQCDLMYIFFPQAAARAAVAQRHVPPETRVYDKLSQKRKTLLYNEVCAFPHSLTNLTRGNMLQLSSKYPEIKENYENEWPLEVLLRQAIIAKRHKMEREDRQRRESMSLHFLNVCSLTMCCCSCVPSSN
jgi:hypothetical protein